MIFQLLDKALVRLRQPEVRAEVFFCSLIPCFSQSSVTQRCGQKRLYPARTGIQNMYLSTAISGTNDTSFRFSAWQPSWAVLRFLPGGVRTYLQPFLGAFGVEEPQIKPSPGLGKCRGSAARPGYHRRVWCTIAPVLDCY